MSFALLMAATSLFDGPGAKSFPEFLHGSPLLFLPQGLVVFLMIYWLIQILYFKKAS